ncbi:MAG: adenylyltransferase/cytidyltransferase family protein [Puniceicoccales bacterium]|jgi:riboflavin kinase/FMN adenylyltransferase|nr:adenylyltransferase/cytidyltransferase family protein [Puniceicoccales bacterium]
MVEVIKTFLDDAAYDFSGKPLFMTIGTFDGVHIGHKKLISSIIEQARNNDGVAVIYTFLPYPTMVITTAKPKPMIYNVEKKYEVLGSYALDNIIEQKFDNQFSKISPYNFITFLKRKFPTLRGISIGEDFKFGRNQFGDAKILQGYGKHFGIEVEIMPLLVLKGKRVSSSHIRELLKTGNVDLASLMLDQKL